MGNKLITNCGHSSKVRSLPAAVLMMALFCCALAYGQHGNYFSATAMASYRPVAVPGTQRRVAQNDAEDKARKLIYEYVGSLRAPDGRTINDILVRDARLQAKILETIRTSELVDWRVTPQCASVQVWMRLDINKIWGVLSQCGY